MMPDLPKSIIEGMDYKTRLKNYEQELHEFLSKAGRLPLYEYDKKIKELVKKWKV